MPFRFASIAVFAIASSALTLPACSQQQAAPPTKAEAPRSGPWTLNPDESGMTYVTIKNGDLGEINTFRSISGSVSETGQAEISITLDSIDTNNEVRDGRMKEFLFETTKHPTAKITAKLDMTPFKTLSVGNSHTSLLDMQIDLHGVQETYEFYVLTTRLGPNKVMVNNKAPLLLDSADYGFEDGLAKLQELAGLDSITPVVTATVSFTFER